MKIKNKVFLVTGAGSGIGKELVLTLLAREAKVAAIDLREESLEGLVRITEGSANKLSTHSLDISDKKAVENLPDELIAKQGNIDGIINCAGIIQPFVKVNELDYSSIEKVMNVNFYGTLYMVKAFLPHLLKRPEAHIVNVSSMGGFLPVPGQSVYGASKAAVKLLTEALYAELKNTGVGVTAVFPGATKTNISGNSGVGAPTTIKNDKEQKFPMLEPKKVAEMIVQGIEKNRFHVFTGKDSNLMNILYRINPNFATNLIAKQMKSLLDK